MPQPYKGLRMKLTVRVPPDLAAEIAAQAEARHQTVNDWLLDAARRIAAEDGATRRSA